MSTNIRPAEKEGITTKELADACGIDLSTLPEAVPAGTKAGTLLPELAEKLGLSADIPVVIGAHDQIVNALGVGVQNPGDAVDTSGTCECITPLFSKLPENLDFQQNNSQFLQEIIQMDLQNKI